MKQTIAQRLIAGLQSRGYALVPEASSRYTVLHKEGAGTASWMWVGANGACRFNGMKRIDGSRPLGPKGRAALLGAPQE